MSRLSKDQLEMIKEKMGVENLWSFSKFSTFENCSWLYKLKYIDRIRVKGDSCYTYFGTIAHDLIQGLYAKEHTYEEMIGKFNQKVAEWQLEDKPELRFPSDNVRDGYIQNLQHYFANVKVLPYNLINERPVLSVFQGESAEGEEDKEKYVFQGYMDAEAIDEFGNLIILDYKTSSMSGFTGKKLMEKAKQLMIYANGVVQHGRMFDGEMKKFTIDQVKIRYDMMKYCNITYTLKNGKEKVTKAERRQWVAHIISPLRKDLEDVSKQIEALEKESVKLAKKMNMKKTTPEDAEGYSVAIGEIELQIEELRPLVLDPIQISEMVEQATHENTLDVFPKFVQDKYAVTDCYIEVELTQEIMDEFIAEMIINLDLITEKSKEDNPEEAFNRSRIENSDSFFCVNLCDMKDHCSFYKEYKEHSAMFITKQDEPSEQDLLAMLGLM